MTQKATISFLLRDFVSMGYINHSQPSLVSFTPTPHSRYYVFYLTRYYIFDIMHSIGRQRIGSVLTTKEGTKIMLSAILYKLWYIGTAIGLTIVAVTKELNFETLFIAYMLFFIMSILTEILDKVSKE